MAEVEVETQFNDGLEMILAHGEPFDKLKTILEEKEKCSLATVQQVAQARIVAEKDNSVSRLGSWTANGIVYVPKGKVYFVSPDYNPILKHAPDAVKAHRSGNEYFISKSELDRIINAAKEDKMKCSREQRVFASEKTENYSIPINEFATDDLTQFLFKEDVQKYVRFLQGAGITKVPIYLPGKEYQNSQKKPFARALWFRNLGGGSGLSGYSRYLDFSNGLRGVRKASVASVAQKISEYENITKKYGIKSPEQLQGVLEKYSKIESLVKE